MYLIAGIIFLANPMLGLIVFVLTVAFESLKNK